MDRASVLSRLRASPTRAGFGLGVVALPLWFGLGYLLAALDRQGALLGPVWVGLLIGLGLLIGWTVPGWRGWRGYLIGGVTVAIVGGVLWAILPPGAVTGGMVMFTGPIEIIVAAVIGGVLTLISSAGFAIAAIVRRLR
jgi:hypothetical protein